VVFWFLLYDVIGKDVRVGTHSMNWDDIRIFLAVARAGQLLAASRRLGVNHATVARRMDTLERDLQTRLLDRRTNGCTLTSEGEAFFQSAERMETEMLDAQSKLGNVDRTISGTVRIGSPDGFGVAFLAPRLGPLLERHPHLKVQLVPVPHAFSLSQREADIVITLERPDEGRLVCRRLTDYTLGLYASAAYISRHGRPARFEDLRHHALVGYVGDLVFSRSLNFVSDFMRNWSPTLEISSALGQAEAVRAGLGVGILHDYIAADDSDFVPLFPDRKISRTYWAVTHESLRNLTRIRVLLEFLAEIVGAERHRFVRGTAAAGSAKASHSH